MIIDILAIDLLGFLILNPLVYLVITKKYDALYPSYEQLSPINLPFVKQITRGFVYGHCILFNPKSAVNHNILNLTESVNFQITRTTFEIILSGIQLVLLLTLIAGIAIFPFIS